MISNHAGGVLWFYTLQVDLSSFMLAFPNSFNFRISVDWMGWAVLQHPIEKGYANTRQIVPRTC